MKDVYKELIKIQEICKNGLLYAKDDHDKENYQLISKISIDLLSNVTNIKYDRDNYFLDKRYVTPSISVRTLIVKNNKIVMVKEKGYYSLPGGWCELYESPIEAAKRETREETGLIIDIDRLLGLLNIENNGINEYAVFFKGNILDDLHIHDSEVSDVELIDIDRLPNLSPSFNEGEFKKILKAYKENTVVIE